MLRGQATFDSPLQTTTDSEEENSLMSTIKSTTGKVYIEKNILLSPGTFRLDHTNCLP